MCTNNGVSKGMVGVGAWLVVEIETRSVMLMAGTRTVAHLVNFTEALSGCTGGWWHLPEALGRPKCTAFEYDTAIA